MNECNRVLSEASDALSGGHENIIPVASRGPFPQSTPPQIVSTPPPPYYAVIFSSRRVHDDGMGKVEDGDDPQGDDYRATADRMMALASQADGFLGVESVRDHNQLGLTVSYWTDLTSIKDWKNHAEHLIAQEKGKQLWYSAYTTRICRVELEYSL